MSTINTNSIDANYPIPGQNNSTQGFRNNFAAIKNNLGIAGSEITDLQNNALLKAPLANTSLNNDMANALISNASVLGFRSTTYNLGNALTNLVTVDLSLGDVQYGNLSGNVLLQFGNWAPTQTQSNVTLQLGRPNNQADFSITFPAEAVFADNYGWTLTENSSSPSGAVTLTFPYDVTQLNLLISSVDCGNTLYVQPINRPMQSVQIQKRTPPTTGQLGDVIGTVCVSDIAATSVLVTSSIGTNFANANTIANTGYLVTSNTDSLYSGMAVVFTGTSFEPNIVTGATYYVSNIANATHFKISSDFQISDNIDMIGGNGNVTLNSVNYMFVAADNYSANSYDKNVIATTAPNTIVVDPASGMSHIAVNYPIIFTGAGVANANVTAGEVYYVKSVSGANITVSKTVDNGIAGPTYENVLSHISDSSFPLDFTVYEGTSIFRQIPLIPGTETTTSAVIPNVADIRIGGGNNGYFLVTDGTGNLSWATGAAYNSISNISNIQTIFAPTGTLVTTSQNHGLTEGAGVTITNVVGMTQLNGKLYYADVVTSNTFLLYTDPFLTTPVNSSLYTPYISGGQIAASLGLVAGANTQVQFNNSGMFGAAAGFTFNSTTGVLSVPGNIVSTNTVIGSNLNTSGNLTVSGNTLLTGNVNIGGNTLVGNLNSGTQIVSAGNIIGVDLYATNLVSGANTGIFGNVISGSANIAGNITCINVSANGNAIFANVEVAGQVAVSGNIFSNSNILSNGYYVSSVTTGITALGSTQADATNLVTAINIVQTAATAGAGVKLPVAQAGLRVIIRNISTVNPINVYPNTGARIDLLAVNAAYSLPINTNIELYCAVGGGSGQWYIL